MFHIKLPGYLPPGLNGSKGLMRMHWGTKHKMSTEVINKITSTFHDTLPNFRGPVRVTFMRKSTRLMDWDNACASFKLVGDALVNLCVIEDDSPDIIHDFIPLQERVKTRKEHGIEITIEPIPQG